MTTVGLYARVSSEKQEKERTIESQVAELEDRIKNDGYKLLDSYKFIDDPGSGFTLEREGLEHLRNKVALGEIDKIYVYSPDRLSRDYVYLMLLLREFERFGKEIIFLDHDFDDTPGSKMLLQVKGIMSEHECALIKERSRRGKLHAAKKGYVSIMGNAPYGYRYIKHEKKEEARFEVNEEEAEVVRKLFVWVVQERLTLRETVRRLKEMCISAPKGKKNWHSSTVHRMLKNPAYKGQAAFGKTKVGPVRQEVRAAWKARKKSYSVYHTDKENWIYIKIPSIINEDLFDTVQKQLAENRKRARIQRSVGIYLLQGLVACKCCKCAYYGVSNGGYGYYRCSGSDASRFDGNKICNSKSIRAEILEMAIWEEVKIVLKEPERIAKEHQFNLLKYENKQPDDILEKQESMLEQGIDKLVDIYTRGYITKEKFDSKIEEMYQSLKAIKKQKEKTLDQKKLQQELDLITNSIQHFCSGVQSELDLEDWQGKRDVIKTLIQYIKIDLDDIHIVWRVKELVQEVQNKNVQHCHRTAVSRTGMTGKKGTVITGKEGTGITGKKSTVMTREGTLR